jgi:hypothetical protein
MNEEDIERNKPRCASVCVSGCINGGHARTGAKGVRIGIPKGKYWRRWGLCIQPRLICGRVRGARRDRHDGTHPAPNVAPRTRLAHRIRFGAAMPAVPAFRPSKPPVPPRCLLTAQRKGAISGPDSLLNHLVCVKKNLFVVESVVAFQRGFRIST